MGESEERSLERAVKVRMSPDERLSPDQRLIAFILPLFHLVVVTLVLVMFAYSSGSLGEQLVGIGTLNGIVLYAVLWLSTTWTTRRALGQAWTRSADQRGGSTETMAAIKWGGINGLLFFAALLVMQLVIVIEATYGSSGSTRPYLPSVREFVLGLFGILPFAAIAAIIAFGVGAAIGYVFSLLDRGALGLGDRIAAWSITASEPDSIRD